MKMTTIESLTVEFKREYSESVKKTIVAFANTDGGTLYIGVEDDGTVVGVSDENIDATQLKITTCIRNAIRPDVSVFTSCRVEEMGQKKVVVVQVQLGTARPYYLEGKGIRPEGVFIRQGASSNPASETAIFNMIRENSALSYEETRCLEQDLTFDTLQAAFQKKSLSLNQQQLKTLKLLRPDEEYTNLALLLSDQCPHTVKIAEFQGTDKTLFRNRAEMGGSLLKQLQDVYDFIDRTNKTKATFAGLERVDLRDYPPQTTRASQDKMMLSQTEERALRLFEESVSLSRKELEKSLAISQSGCINLLNKLVRLGFVQKNGSGKNVVYKKVDR